MNCTQCGTAFGAEDTSCSVCGSTRPAADADRWAPAQESAEWTTGATVIGGSSDEARRYVVPPQPPRSPQAPDPSYQRFQPPAATPAVPVAPPAPAPGGDPSWPYAQPTAYAAPQPTAPVPAVHPVPVAPATVVPTAQPTGVVPAGTGPSGLELPASSSNAKPVLIGVGAVVAVLVLAAAAFVALKDDPKPVAAPATGPKPVKPATLLDAADEEAAAAYDKLSSAVQLSQINQAGTDAEAATKAVDDLIDEVDLVASPAARTATRAALEETREVLNAFAGLKGFDGMSAEQWPILSASIDQHSDELDEALDRLDELKAYEPDEDPVDQIKATQGDLDTSVGTITTKLADWKAQVDQVNADKAAKIASLDEYADSVRPLISRYSGLRREMQEFVDRVDTVGVTYDEAYSFLSSATSSRQSVRTSLAGLTPPATMASAHSGLVAVVDTAIGAVNDAASGVREHEDSYYGYYKDTPGWQTYMAKSDQITGSFNAAVDVWDQAVEKERAAIEAVQPPPKPVV